MPNKRNVSALFKCQLTVLVKDGQFLWQKLVQNRLCKRCF